MSHSSIYCLRTEVSEKATNAAISFLKFLLIASECKSEMVTQTYTTHSKKSITVIIRQNMKFLKLHLSV